ncbi:hypothetical protein DVH24_023193 [Malus domestica]|uniref:Cyclic nucleotide-binding domain-containing protein n=1 Tax=Malus domestica TaxID=3750 RepID=A0A498KLM2_MALDO|nr:hypothetical protein DVH24_023193 [Malus domestica]
MEKVKQALEESTNANWDNIFPLLPPDLQSHRKDARSLAWLKQVPMLRGIDENVLKIIYAQLKPVQYTENNDIIQKDQPLDQILFIVDGELCDYDGSKRGAGELFGEELLRWPFYSDFPSKQPSATEYVKTNGVVEALALTAHDLKNIYGQSDIKRKEKPRHIKMMKEEVEQHMNSWICKNGIPEKLNNGIKSQIIENLALDYWDTLPSDWYNLVSHLHSDFQNKIKPYMPLTKLKEMPIFNYMEESVLKQICSHLRPKKYYSASGDIIKRGDPIQMFFVVDGYISDQSFNEKGPKQIYGEELLHWPFLTSFPHRQLSLLMHLVLTAEYMERVATEFQKHFIKNYGRLVHKLDGPYFSYFREREIKEATRDYTRLNYPNEGGYGTVYHTKLHGADVAIKTCNSATGDPFVQSQTHTNVERLLGCCLETRWPIMVYDRTEALTLVEHFHRNKSKLSLESRMKIAAETAGALAHMHSRSVDSEYINTSYNSHCKSYRFWSFTIA